MMERVPAELDYKARQRERLHKEKRTSDFQVLHGKAGHERITKKRHYLPIDQIKDERGGRSSRSVAALELAEGLDQPVPKMTKQPQESKTLRKLREAIPPRPTVFAPPQVRPQTQRPEAVRSETPWPAPEDPTESVKKAFYEDTRRVKPSEAKGRRARAIRFRG